MDVSLPPEAGAGNDGDTDALLTFVSESAAAPPVSRSIAPPALATDPTPLSPPRSAGPSSSAFVILIVIAAAAGFALAWNLRPRHAAPEQVTARFEVTSEPASAQVNVDDRWSGTTPFVIPDLSPGFHKVVVTFRKTTITRNVQTEPGTDKTVAVVFTR